MYQLVVPNNEELLQVFENDEYVHLFFIGLEEKEEDSSIGSQKDVSYREKILSLKDNHFVEDLVLLE